MGLIFGTLFVLALIFWTTLWQLIKWAVDFITSKFER